MIKRIMRWKLFSEFDSMVGWLALVRAIGALGFALTIPFLTLYLFEELDVPMTQIGLMLTISGLIGASASTIGGSMSDRYGRRKVLIPLLVGRTIIFLFLAWIVLSRQPFLFFAAVFIINGFLGTATFPVMDAIIADVTPTIKRSEAYGLLRVAANLGWAFGPAIGGFVVVAGYHWLFFSTAAILGCITLLSWSRIQETWHAVTRIRRGINLSSIRQDGFLLRFLAVCLVLFLVKGQLIATLSIHASTNVGLSKIQIGMLYFLNAGLVILFQIPISKLLIRYRPLRVLLVSGLFYCVGYFWVGLAQNWLVMSACVAVVTIGEMIEGPTAGSFVSVLAPREQVGVYMGVFNLVVHLGWAIGPLLGGILFETIIDPVYIWGSIAFIALLASFGFLGLDRIRRDVEQ